MTAAAGYRIGVDVGGTFTDLAVAPDGGDGIVLHKILSTADPAEGLLEGLDEVAHRLGHTRAELLARTHILVYGTTVATNALLERRGAKTALLTNEGLRDALQMRGGTRDEPFDNWSVQPAPLVARRDRLGLPGRIDVRGTELEPLDRVAVSAAVDGLGPEVGAVAICLMHSHANDAHERIVARSVREAIGDDVFVSTSSELLPQLGFEDRLRTTTVNAYVGPVMSAHLADVSARLTEAGLAGRWVVMQSNGGTITPQAARARPVVTVLSGPAAAPVVGAAIVTALDVPACIAVDMGGTSFDISLIRDGVPLMSFDGLVGDINIAVPLLDIHTIGAGGGSIGWIDDRGILRMGPRSAGSRPGPAAYGRGGRLPTCTDASVALGYLHPDSFEGAEIKLDRDAAVAAIEHELAGPLGLGVQQAAAGMYQVLVAEMAAGIREVTVERGLDPRGMPLVVGGGAGALHAAAVADELGIEDVVIPYGAATMSALGMLMTDFVHDAVRAHAVALQGAAEVDAVNAALAELAGEARLELVHQGVPADRIVVSPRLELRYEGQFHRVTVVLDPDLPATGDSIRRALDDEHELLYGYAMPGAGVEVINLRVRATGAVATVPEHRLAVDNGRAGAAGRRHVYLGDEWIEVTVFDGDGVDRPVLGPVIVELPASTALVPPGWAVTSEPGVGLLMHSGGSA